MNVKNKAMIKLCPNPKCSAVYHNIEKAETQCPNCRAQLVIIENDTYWKDYAKSWYQYDFKTGKYFRPKDPDLKIMVTPVGKLKPGYRFVSKFPRYDQYVFTFHSLTDEGFINVDELGGVCIALKQVDKIVNHYKNEQIKLF